MKALIITMGSRGDMNPLLLAADRLKNRGNDVLLCGSENHRESVEQLGIRFVAHTDRATVAAIENTPELWHHTRALPALIRTGIVPSLERIYHIIEEEMCDEFAVVSSPLAFAARLAEEKLGIRLVHVHLAPAVLRSLHDTSQVGVLPMGPGLPKVWKRSVWWLIDYCILDPQIRAPLNRFRKKLGLRPVRRVFNGWWLSARSNALLFSELFAPPQPDWPASARRYDFLCFDGSGTVPPEADAFLGGDDPPVVFTFGTAFAFARDLFQVSLQALDRLGRRGIFLSENPANMPDSLPPQVLGAPFLPLGKILPRCAAIVHHGGIGTIAQAARAGIPQLIRPMAFDQPDNAHRVRQQKLGDWIRPRDYCPDRLCERLDFILHDSQIRAGCRHIAHRIDSEAALERLVRDIEQIGQSRHGGTATGMAQAAGLD